MAGNRAAAILQLTSKVFQMGNWQTGFCSTKPIINANIEITYSTAVRSKCDYIDYFICGAPRDSITWCAHQILTQSLSSSSAKSAAVLIVFETMGNLL